MSKRKPIFYFTCYACGKTVTVYTDNNGWDTDLNDIRNKPRLHFRNKNGEYCCESCNSIKDIIT